MSADVFAWFPTCGDETFLTLEEYTFCSLLTSKAISLRILPRRSLKGLKSLLLKFVVAVPAFRKHVMTTAAKIAFKFLSMTRSFFYEVQQSTIPYYSVTCVRELLSMHSRNLLDWISLAVLSFCKKSGWLSTPWGPGLLLWGFLQSFE